MPASRRSGERRPSAATTRRTRQVSPFDSATIARLLQVDIELNAQGIAVWLDKLD
jgi:hypothetical protein